MVVEPLLVASVAEVAAIVPPPLAVQNTVELKLPVPETVAVHWLVCWDVIEVGLQLAPTSVTVGVVEPPPLLQAANSARHHTPARVPRIRTPAPLLDLSDISTLWHHGRNISPAMEAACVSTLLKNETGCLHEYRAMSAMLLRHCLFHRLKVGTQKLLQIGLKRSLPRDAEDGDFRRDKLAHRLPGGDLEFVRDIALRGDTAQRPLHARFFGLYGGDVVAQRRPGRKGQCQQ